MFWLTLFLSNFLNKYYLFNSQKMKIINGSKKWIPINNLFYFIFSCKKARLYIKTPTQCLSECPIHSSFHQDSSHQWRKWDLAGEKKLWAAVPCPPPGSGRVGEFGKLSTLTKQVASPTPAQQFTAWLWMRNWPWGVGPMHGAVEKRRAAPTSSPPPTGKIGTWIMTVPHLEDS